MKWQQILGLVFFLFFISQIWSKSNKNGTKSTTTEDGSPSEKEKLKLLRMNSGLSAENISLFLLLWLRVWLRFCSKFYQIWSLYNCPWFNFFTLSLLSPRHVENKNCPFLGVSYYRVAHLSIFSYSV